MFRLLYYLILFFLINYFTKGICALQSTKKVLVISLDGFRHDYLDIAAKNGINISAFQYLISEGVRLKSLKNVFVSKTFPTHFSLATGLYVESHGIIGNRFYDPKLKKTFSSADYAMRDPDFWDVGAEPVWITNEKNGYKSGTIYWPGSLSTYGGMSSTLSYGAFKSSVNLKEQLNVAYEWLFKRDANLVMVYNFQPDSTGHRTGPASPDVLRTIENLNYAINSLLNKVSLKRLNILVLSDHGMTKVLRPEIPFTAITNLLKGEQYSVNVKFDTLIGIEPKNKQDADKFVNLLQNKISYLHVSKKTDLPQRFHYTNTYRIPTVLAYTDLGHVIGSIRTEGTHGYDPKETEMQPFFIAAGPGIRRRTDGVNYQINTVDVYPLICKLLGLNNMAPNNGSFDRIKFLLNSEPAIMQDYLSMTLCCLITIFILPMT